MLVSWLCGTSYASFAEEARNNGNFPVARNLFLESLGWWENEDVRDSLGSCLVEAGEFEEAEKVFLEAIQHRGGQGNGLEHYFLGYLHFIKGNSASATEELEKIHEKNKFCNLARVLLAIQACDNGDYAKAKSLIKPLEKIVVSQIGHLYVLIFIAFSEGRNQEAINMLKKIDPTTLLEPWKTRFQRLPQKFPEARTP